MCVILLFRHIFAYWHVCNGILCRCLQLRVGGRLHVVSRPMPKCVCYVLVHVGRHFLSKSPLQTVTCRYKGMKLMYVCVSLNSHPLTNCLMGCMNHNLNTKVQFSDLFTCCFCPPVTLTPYDSHCVYSQYDVYNPPLNTGNILYSEWTDIQFNAKKYFIYLWII